MNPPPNNNNSRPRKKPIIDLPAQNIWKELEAYGAESLQQLDANMKKTKPKKIQCLLDQAFELLLEKLNQQN